MPARSRSAGRGSPLPRPEYPRPQRVRPRWRNLNGLWQIAADPGDRGLRQGWERARPFEGRIRVPYPIGAPLSGWCPEEAPPLAWYRRTVHLEAGEIAPRVALQIGACDYATRVFVNGRQVGSQRGGYMPIRCEVGHLLHAGENEVVLRVSDPPTWSQPRGKQAAGAARTPVDYDPAMGVWQTVWLEPLPPVSIEDVWTRWDSRAGELAVHVAFSELWEGDVDVLLCREGTVCCRASAGGWSRPEARVVLRIDEPHLWSPADPFLYGLRVELRRDAAVMDRVESYAGLREIAVEGRRIQLNGEPLYLRGVLDQGYFPGGWLAAASDEDLRRDVEWTRALGFNTARKHQKLEDPRYLYWADRLGLLVWSEMPSGRDFTTALVEDLMVEWTRALRRDRSHPCILAWVPFNESWGVWQQARRREQRAFVEGMVGLTRALDPTRLVVGNDGWEYAAGDLWTLHLYEEAGAPLRERLAQLLEKPTAPLWKEGSHLGERLGALPGSDVSQLPVLLTECGGIGYREPDAPGSREPVFAYGELPGSPAELEERIRSVLEGVRECSELSGFVWTQLTDVQQEINGLLDFQRRPKLPVARLRSLFGAAARGPGA